MRVWEAASLAFFVFVALVALVSPRRPPQMARLAAGLGAGLAFVAAIAALPFNPVVHDWVAPPIALLLGYWTSGLLYAGPIASQERALLAFDRRLRVHRAAAACPRPLATLLEIAYAGVYPVIPIALTLHLLFVPRASAEGFWNVVLVTDYVCFAGLAFVQTRPPRALEGIEPWNGPVRRFNLQMLGAASIQVNTFPSGHAAEALAAALLVVGAPWPPVAAMFAVALAISAGAVLGRYHYAADAIAGWAIAMVVFVVLRP